MIKTTSSHTLKLSDIDPKLARSIVDERKNLVQNSTSRTSPGPWYASFTDSGCNVRDRDGGLLFVNGPYFNDLPPTPKQMEADAKLAAQAPTLKAQNEELLGALKWAAISLADGRHRNDVFQAHLKNCEAVIYRVESHNEH